MFQRFLQFRSERYPHGRNYKDRWFINRRTKQFLHFRPNNYNYTHIHKEQGDLFLTFGELIKSDGEKIQADARQHDHNRG